MEPMVLIRRALLGMLATGFGVLALAMSGRMNSIFAAIRQAMAGAGTMALLAVLATTPAAASEVSATGAARAGLVIHDAAEVLRDFCHTDADGRMWLALPNGSRFELVTSTDDPVILNPGDGRFHPFDRAEVERAIATVGFPLGRIVADIYLLPFPRRSGLESAAGPGLILLSPGVLDIAPAVQHAEVVHELGHVVQRALLPDDDAERWADYRRLRGIGDPTTYSASSPHADRPHEIFAEDFRALFGGSLAVSSGTIENASLAHPAEVGGLAEFLRALAEQAPALAFTAWPNPGRGALTLARSGGAAVALDVVDAAGRRVTTLEPQTASGAVLWRWNGRDAAGRDVAPGVLFARPRDGGPAARLVRLP